MNARPQWMLRTAPVVPPYLACERCTSGRSIATQLYCVRKTVTQAASAVPVSKARSRDGECGPDAKWQTDRAGV